MKEKNTIFLAHASEDKGYVREIYKKLKATGLEPWLDEEGLVPGIKWDQEIIKVIKNSRFFLACLSKNSVSKNGYIQKELKTALAELEKKSSEFIYFIPVLIENIDIPNINVGTICLRDYQAIKIFEKNGSNKLIKYLKKVIESENNSEPTTVHSISFDHDSGCRCWYIVEVDENMNYQFLKAVTYQLAMDLNDFGIIHYRGWGNEPPEAIKQECRERFGLFKN